MKCITDVNMLETLKHSYKVHAASFIHQINNFMCEHENRPKCLMLPNSFHMTHFPFPLLPSVLGGPLGGLIPSALAHYIPGYLSVGHAHNSTSGSNQQASG